MFMSSHCSRASLALTLNFFAFLFQVLAKLIFVELLATFTLKFLRVADLKVRSSLFISIRLIALLAGELGFIELIHSELAHFHALEDSSAIWTLIASP